jgi:hypothetical protein
MRRWLYVSLVSAGLIAGCLFLTASVSKSGAAEKNRSDKQRPKSKEEFVVKVEQWGPSQEQIDEKIVEVVKDPAVDQYLSGNQYRLITFEYIDPDNKKGSEREPDRYRAIFYDYTNERSIIVLGNFSKAGELEVSVSSFQPLPSPDEFDAAVRIIENDPELGAALRAKKLAPYPPMPPLYFAPGIRSPVTRVINVGLRAKNPDDPVVQRDNEVFQLERHQSLQQRRLRIVHRHRRAAVLRGAESPVSTSFLSTLRTEVRFGAFSRSGHQPRPEPTVQRWSYETFVTKARWFSNERTCPS